MNRSEALANIQHIRCRWERGDSAREIAAAVHLPQRLVIEIIQTGQFPEPQPQWIQGDLFAGQPDRDEISKR